MDDDVQVSLDLYPGAVALPGSRTMQPVRVLIGDDYLRVLRSGGGPTPVVEFEGPVTALFGTVSTGWRIETESGTITARSTGGCRCGSGSLLSFDPWPGRRRVRVRAIPGG